MSWTEKISKYGGIDSVLHIEVGWMCHFVACGEEKKFLKKS
jgi:hypothetical protein